jgi:hypothetical protein
LLALSGPSFSQNRDTSHDAKFLGDSNRSAELVSLNRAGEWVTQESYGRAYNFPVGARSYRSNDLSRVNPL